MNPLEEKLKRRIAEHGPISVAAYMAEANTHYYATRDPLGAAGDFVTAPEISQMFGELVGAWLADLWMRAGRPGDSRYVELGPGRGTLAMDALRAMAAAGLKPPVHLVETSPVLREAQARNLPGASWHDDPDSLHEEGPLLVVANEFFDALPVHQFDPAGSELSVGIEDGRFVRLGDAAWEHSPASLEIAGQLARRLVAQGGAALIVDYGHAGGGAGDSLQSVQRHTHVDPFAEPGERDLTALGDFAALAGAARDSGALVSGPIEQGRWLEALGIGVRSAALGRAAPERAEQIERDRARLVAPDQMGCLFKVMALTAPGWPEPAGFIRSVSGPASNGDGKPE